MDDNNTYILLDAINKKPIQRTPIWIMRQAGRYLPEYRATKEEAGGFIKLIRNPELACEVTLQPLRRFQLDASILFSDILIISDLLRMELQFIEKKGPVFDAPLSSQKDLDLIGKPDLLQIYACLQRCEIYVGNDSGLMHMAAAAGIPTGTSNLVLQQSSLKCSIFFFCDDPGS